MKTLVYISILIILIIPACNSTSTGSGLATDTDTAKTILADSLFTDNLFYSVYELSPKTIAMVINFSESEKESICDTIFKHISLTDSLEYSILSQPKNSKYYDTTGKYRLLRSEKLELEIKKHFEYEWYVYGTRGIAKGRIKNIVFGLNECWTNIFAFCLDIDTSLIGHPLLASRKFFKFNYNHNYQNIEKGIQRLYSKQPELYTNIIKTKVVANEGSMYLTYSDDFQWGGNPKSEKCLFPSRIIFKLQTDSTLLIKWSDELDLFGIPCD